MPILEVQDLTIATPDQVILAPVTFSVEAEEFLSIKGPSGAGKSTLLKHLVGLNDPNLKVEGRCLFNGKSLESYPPQELRQEISYCFQSPQLFGDTVRDNLSFPSQIRKQLFDEDKAFSLLEKMNLTRDFLDKPIDQLSGGEKQRIALIRNLLYPPQVLLLDEITSALDTENRQSLWRGLHAFIKEEKITVLFISHLEEDQEMADRTVVLEKPEKKKD